MPFPIEPCIGNQAVNRRQRRNSEEGGHIDLTVIHQQHRVFAALNQQLAEEGFLLRGIAQPVFQTHAPAGEEGIVEVEQG